MVPGSSSISGSSRGSAGPTSITTLTITIRTGIPTDTAMDMGIRMAPDMDMIPAVTAAPITTTKTATIPLTTISAAMIPLTTISAATILLTMIGTATVLMIGQPLQQKLPTSRTNWREQVITMDESTASSGRKHVTRWSVIRAPKDWSRAEI